MGQKNKKKKKYKNTTKAKQITTFVILQIIAIVLFASMIYNSVPISPERVECTSIQIINIKNVRRFHEFRVCVYTENESYEFPNFGEIPKSTLLDKIKEEEEISIKYVKTYGGFKCYNLIVDARSESEVYLSLEDYNAKRPLIGVIILILILESILIGACVTYYIFYHGLQFSRKKRKKNKKHSKSHKNSIK